MAHTTTLQKLEREINERAKIAIEIARTDYHAGMRDCQSGIYDKWYRYSRDDDGRAYDLGWQYQNETTKNDSVKFIERSIF